MTNTLKGLADFGQAPWLDYLHREILDGELRRLIADDGLKGLTSNPSIFEKAIGGGDAYDETLKTLIAKGDDEVVALYERLAIADIQGAADQFRPVWDSLHGRDGFVSLEVSPYLARDTRGTIAEAQRLWRAVDRPNLLIKAPGTKEGVPAIRQLISEGININVTLLFGIEAYEAVAWAFIEGLEALKAAGGDVSRVHSVASVFVSRIDTAVDRAIDSRLEKAGDGASALHALRGKVAIANSKIAYQRYLEIVDSPRWRTLSDAGASPQRLLWASTGAKDPAYRDVLYVEELIGPETVDTMPPATMDAFRDHGRLANTLTSDLDAARQVLSEAARLGIDLDAVTDQLVDEGIDKFAESFDDLLGAVADKRTHILGSRLNTQWMKTGDLSDPLGTATDRATHEGWTRRLWAKDASLWPGGEAGKWLGWLDAASGACVDLQQLKGLREQVKAAGYAHALLLGMGGSSLGPEVLARTFGAAAGFPELIILDSTDPAQVTRVAGEIDPARTLFIVSSKSGSTLEPDVLRRYFFDLVEKALGKGKAGARFIAITDPGSKLEETARADGFWRVFHGEPTIGGRYSVLSNFGMVPAAVIGLDVEAIFDSVAVMRRACGPSAPPKANPGVELGLLLGVAGQAGRDKVSLIVSEPIGDLGAWLEQLIAESTGKHGKGLIPIDMEPLGPARVYGSDRVFAYVRLEHHDDPARDQAVRDLEEAGQPVVRITLANREMIFQEFFRWEVAIAMAGAVIGIDAFDQPDVEASKVKTRALTADFERTGRLAPQEPVATSGAFRVFSDPTYAKSLRNGDGGNGADGPQALITQHLARARAGDYVALLAYIDRNEAHQESLQAIRHKIRDKRKVATTLEFGPRFLHSTGQAYKGGPDSGVFLQITGGDGPPVPIPGLKMDFATVESAEARGDFEVLAERGRRVLRLDLGGDVEAGLAGLARMVDRALS
jgi:transaldolase/glucose-6-phosphate isomerase